MARATGGPWIAYTVFTDANVSPMPTKGAVRMTLVSSETIFEVRWHLASQPTRPLGPEDLPSDMNELMTLIMGSPSDPWYTAGTDRIAAAAQQRYPRHERLPSALVPPGLARFTVQERFRSANDWPLVQIGPGIVTFNTLEVPVNASESAKELDALWQEIRALYPTHAAIRLAGLSCSVVERHSLPSVAALPPMLEQLGLPPLAAPARGLAFAGQLLWESTFADPADSSVLVTWSVRARLPAAPRPSGEAAEPGVEWRRVISDNAERSADDPIVPALVRLNDRIGRVGGFAHDATD